MIKSIIFDFDGLICDTETPEIEAWKSLFREYNQEFPIDEYLKSIGSIYNDRTPLFHLKKMINKPLDIDDLMIEFQKRKMKFNESEPLMPCVLEYLNFAKKSGLLIGLASSSPSEWIQYHIDRLKIFEFFDCIMTSSDVDKTKPDPELYQKTIKCLEIEPFEAIALEDSPNGVSAALRAGMNVVAIPNQVTSRFNFDQAHFIFQSLCDISLKDLIEKFNKQVT